MDSCSAPAGVRRRGDRANPNRAPTPAGSSRLSPIAPQSNSSDEAMRDVRRDWGTWNRRRRAASPMMKNNSPLTRGPRGRRVLRPAQHLAGSPDTSARPVRLLPYVTFPGCLGIDQVSAVPRPRLSPSPSCSKPLRKWAGKRVRERSTRSGYTQSDGHHSCFQTERKSAASGHDTTAMERTEQGGRPDRHRTSTTIRATSEGNTPTKCREAALWSKRERQDSSLARLPVLSEGSGGGFHRGIDRLSCKCGRACDRRRRSV